MVFLRAVSEECRNVKEVKSLVILLKHVVTDLTALFLTLRNPDRLSSVNALNLCLKDVRFESRSGHLLCRDVF
jgi:hypothetical protein